MANTLLSKYGLKRVINASGRMSVLGVSTPTDSVMEAMKAGGQVYVEMADLVDKAGAHVAQALGSEDAVVVNSASSGIVLTVAALVTKGCPRKSRRLHQDPLADNEIIMFKGHNVDYGAPIETMVYLGGGRVVEVGYANEGKAHHIAEAISPHTAALLYVQSHHAVQKNMLSLKETCAVAKRHNIPLIVDAAAEEDLKQTVACADLAIFSGSKALEGPTSGLVAGKKQYVDWLKVQLSGIGRSMKVGKEAIFGLLQALDDYATKTSDHAAEAQRLQPLLTLSDIPGIQVAIVKDEAGRGIERARVQVDAALAGTTARELAIQLRAGAIAIYTRDYGVAEGYFDIDPRPLSSDDVAVIVEQIRELLLGSEGSGQA